jgi:predicted nucleic acid-binding protein
MGLKVRNRELTKSQAEEALVLLHEDIVPHAKVLEVAATDFRLAETMLREFSLGLRSCDALHVAIASRSGARLFVTLDQKLAKVATSLGLDVAAT